MQIISIVNLKGGTGKTTTTLNLGKALSLLDKRVLLIDNDPQYNLTKSFAVDVEDKTIYNVYKNTSKESILNNIVNINNHLCLVPCSIELAIIEYELHGDAVNGSYLLKDALSHISGDYDYVLIDCPPSLGIFTLNALKASDKAIIICDSDAYAKQGLEKIMEFIGNLKKRECKHLSIDGVLVTRVNRTVFRQAVLEALCQVYPTYQTYIHENISITEAPELKKDIFSHAPKSKGAEDYMNLAKEILGKHELVNNN